jgi:inorganic pyrophosphatase
MRRALVSLGLATLLLPCAARAGDPTPGDVSTTPIAAGLVQQDAQTITGPHNFLSGWPATVADGTVNAVVEVPAGYVDKWEVKNVDGWLHWDLKDGKPRRVKYLGYPCNYGMVPRTVLSKARGGDGDPLDVVLLGAALPRGTVVPARVIGLLEMSDGGELDVKLVAVRDGTAFEAIRSVAELDAQFPGVTSIVETWFQHYKGPGVVETRGFGDVARALGILRDASSDFEKEHAASGARSEPKASEGHRAGE